ncbi:hypothetical protein CPB86DRAFT_148020 [Serendipita vermifera]|nr:hypothetical protein CPB86DRAFT_148020 [Serendipita vermifera]
MRNKFCLRLLKLHCAQLLIVGQVLHLRLRRVLPPSLLINRVLHDLDYSKRWIFFGRKRLSISDDLGNHEMTLPFGGSPSRVFTWTTDRISIKNEDVQLFTVTSAMRDGGRTFRPSVKVRAMSLGGRRASVEGVGILGLRLGGCSLRSSDQNHSNTNFIIIPCSLVLVCVVWLPFAMDVWADMVSERSQDQTKQAILPHSIILL